MSSNYPCGSNTSSAPWNQSCSNHETCPVCDEIAYHGDCSNCGAHLKVVEGRVKVDFQDYDTFVRYILDETLSYSEVAKLFAEHEHLTEMLNDQEITQYDFLTNMLCVEIFSDDSLLLNVA